MYWSISAARAAPCSADPAGSGRPSRARRPRLAAQQRRAQQRGGGASSAEPDLRACLRRRHDRGSVPAICRREVHDEELWPCCRACTAARAFAPSTTPSGGGLGSPLSSSRCSTWHGEPLASSGCSPATSARAADAMFPSTPGRSPRRRGARSPLLERSCGGRAATAVHHAETPRGRGTVCPPPSRDRAPHELQVGGRQLVAGMNPSTTILGSRALPGHQHRQRRRPRPAPGLDVLAGQARRAG